MEPRPQRSRTGPDQGRPADPQAPPIHGPNLEQSDLRPGASQGPPPSTPPHGGVPYDRTPIPPRPPESDAVAHGVPNRTDYDYSPLDLPPPGERRRRRVATAGLAVLGAIIVIGLGAFAFALARDGGDDLTALGVSGTATREAELVQIAAMETAVAGGDVATEPATGATPVPDSPGDVAGAGAPVASPTDVAGAAEPTQTAAELIAAVSQTATARAEADDAGVPTTIEGMLPDVGDVPAGLVLVSEIERTQEEVAAALEAADANERLTAWGWRANTARTFAAEEFAAPEATTLIDVSIHRFGTAEATTEAFTYFSDVLVVLGFQEIEVGEVGDQARGLSRATEEGSNGYLYVRSGSLLIRMSGFSATGDPMNDLVALAQIMLTG